MKRQAAILALAGAGGVAWWLSRRQEGEGVYAPVDLGILDLGSVLGGDDGGGSGDAGGPGSAGGVDIGGFLPALGQAENPGGGLWTKNPYSTASGKYQFVKATWTGLGGDWGDDPTQAFGGLRPSEAEQDAMAARLTAGNANLLSRAGAAVTSASLYAAHIFGPSKAARVLNSDPSTPLADLVGAHTAAINPALGTTVSSFLDYLARKVG